MNHEEGQAFFNAIVNDVWSIETGAVDNIEKYYHKDLHARFNHEIVVFDDLIRRFHFLHEKFKQQTFDVKELLVDGDNIIVHFSYQAESKSDDNYGISPENEGIVIYTLENGKVKRVVSFFQAPINYAACQ